MCVIQHVAKTETNRKDKKRDKRTRDRQKGMKNGRKGEGDSEDAFYTEFYGVNGSAPFITERHTFCSVVTRRSRDRLSVATLARASLSDADDYVVCER